MISCVFAVNNIIFLFLLVLSYDQELSIVSSPDGEPVIARHVNFEITDEIGSSDRINDDDDIQHFNKPLEGND
jgi:hypothetical protein